MASSNILEWYNHTHHKHTHKHTHAWSLTPVFPVFWLPRMRILTGTILSSWFCSYICSLCFAFKTLQSRARETPCSLLKKNQRSEKHSNRFFTQQPAILLTFGWEWDPDIQSSRIKACSVSVSKQNKQKKWDCLLFASVWFKQISPLFSAREQKVTWVICYLSEGTVCNLGHQYPGLDIFKTSKHFFFTIILTISKLFFLLLKVTCRCSFYNL